VTPNSSARCHTREHIQALTTDFWYNKWAGGDKEDALAKYV